MLATPKMPKLLTYSNVDNNSDFDNNNSSICQESPPFSELEFHTSSDIKTREGRRFSSFQRQTQFPPWGIPSSGSTNPAGARMTTTTTMPPLMEIGHLYPIVTDLSDVEFQQSNAEISSNLNARCLSTFTTIVSQPQPRNKDGTTTSISGAANSSSSNSSSMTPSFWRGGRDWKRRRSARHTNNNRDDDGTRRHHTRSSSEGAATLLLESSNSFHLDDENNNDYVEEKEVKEKNNTSSSSFDDQYVLTRSIFQCERSSLWECVHRSTGERFCVKIMDFMDENVLHEVAMLKAAQGHGTVVELIQVFFEDSYNENDVSPGSEHSRSSGKIYLIMEFMAGGNLLSFVIQNGGLSEDVVRRLAVELLQAVEHLHTVAFLCHNDLNPSNILLDDPTCDSLKVSDFGSSISIHDSQKWINKHNKVEWDSCSKVDNSNSSVSTTRSLEKSSRSTNCHHTTNHPFRTATIGNDFSEFCAPEALYQRSGNRSASPTADMWSVGAVLSFCLLGQYGTSGVSLYPNSGNSETMLVAHGRSKSIGNDELMHSNLQRERHLTGSHVSRQAKQFLSSLLQLDPSLRLTPQEALGHSWLAGTVKQPSRKLSSPFVATESPVFAPPMTLNKPKFTDLAKKLHSKSPRSNPTISVLVAISYFTECFSSRLGNGCNLAVDSLKR